MKKAVLFRISVFTLTVLMIFVHIPFSSLAYTGLSYPNRYNSAQTSVIDDLSEYVDIDELRAYLFEAFKTCPEKIDIAFFNIPSGLKDSLQNFIWYEMPESFHVYALGASVKYNKLSYLIASYSFTSDEYLTMLAEFEEKAGILLKDISGNDDLSDAEKALLIHDRLAVYCDYDLNAENCYIAYAALVGRRAVCDGYSKAYSYLLRQVGIESLHCSSESMCHAWNLVLIDGKYYHVDVTWDDPVCTSTSKTYEGSVTHTNFLRSNDGIVNDCGHNATDFYAPAFDTTYDDYFWQCSTTEFQLVDGQIYYIDNESEELKRLNEDRVSGTALYSVKNRWMKSANRYWSGNFSKLSSGSESLFFSSPDTVYVYDISNSKATAVFTPELEGYDYIYGFTYSDGYFVCDINNAPSQNVSRLRQVRYLYIPPVKLQILTGIPVTITAYDATYNFLSEDDYEAGTIIYILTDDIKYIEIESDGRIGKLYKPADYIDSGLELSLDINGDANGDGKLNNKDVAFIFRAVLYEDTLPIADVADVNYDGKINNKDMVLLFRYILDPQNITLVPHSVFTY